MKKLLKLLSAFAILISSFTFAQTDCFPDNFPIKIGTPIKTDQFDWNFDRNMNVNKMTSYLVAFESSFKKHSYGEKIPTSYVEAVNNIDSNYYTLINELVSKSDNFESFRKNVLSKLKESKSATEIEALILMDYSSQIIESSKMYNLESSSLSFRCIATTIGLGSTSVMMDTGSLDGLGNDIGGIAGGGCTPQFPFPGPKYCN